MIDRAKHARRGCLSCNIIEAFEIFNGIFMQEPLNELPQMPDIFTSHIDPMTGEDDSYDDMSGMGLITTRLPPLQIVQPDPQDTLGEDPDSWVGVVSRNAPCPCGSGQKYKHCHGSIA